MDFEKYAQGVAQAKFRLDNMFTRASGPGIEIQMSVMFDLLTEGTGLAYRDLFGLLYDNTFMFNTLDDKVYAEVTPCGWCGPLGGGPLLPRVAKELFGDRDCDYCHGPLLPEEGHVHFHGKVGCLHRAYEGEGKWERATWEDLMEPLKVFCCEECYDDAR